MRFQFNPGFLAKRIGVQDRRVATPTDTTSSLCVKAAEKLKSITSLGDAEVLVVCTQNPDFRLPHTSALLQDRLGLPTHTAAFDINLGCSGYIYALDLTWKWMEAHNHKQGLIFTCDPYSKILDPNDRTTVPLFSDAAAVTLLGRGNANRLGKSVFGTDGSLSDALMLPHHNGNGSTVYLKMDGRRLFKYLLQKIPQLIGECLEKNELSPEDIDHYVFHQASACMLTGLQDKLGISASKMVNNLATQGNTVSSSIPLALQKLLQTKDMQGKTMLLCGFGVGLSWGATILYT